MPITDIKLLDQGYLRRIKKLKNFCRQIIDQCWHTYEPAEISLVLGKDVLVRELNLKYRGIDSTTNVLSFENTEKPIKGQVWLAGDIIIGYRTVVKEAREQGKTFESHFAHLLIHGSLHLQGYDHLEEKQAQEMEALETRLMKKMGYEDPYKDVI